MSPVPVWTSSPPRTCLWPELLPQRSLSLPESRPAEMPEPPLVFDGLPPGPSFSRTPAPGAVRHRGRVFFLREEMQKRQKSLPPRGETKGAASQKAFQALQVLPLEFQQLVRELPCARAGVRGAVLGLHAGGNARAGALHQHLRQFLGGAAAQRAAEIPIFAPSFSRLPAPSASPPRAAMAVWARWLRLR